MPEHRMYFDIHFKDAKQRDDLVTQITANGNQIALSSETLQCEAIQVDDLISFWADSADLDSLKSSVGEWIKPFNPSALVAKPAGNYYEEECIGIVNGKDVANPKALKAIAAASQRASNGLAVSSKTEKGLLKHINDNEVDPLESFQGERFIDRLFEYGHEGAVRYFIDEGLIDPNHQVTSSYTYDHSDPLIHKVIYFDDFHSVRKLVEQGIDVNILDESNNTLLHLIIHGECNLEKLGFLIEHGVDPNQQNDDGDNVLMTGMGTGYFDTDNVRFLLENGVDPNHLNNAGENVLMIAVRNGDREEFEEWEDIQESFKLLQSHGAQADQLDNNGCGILLSLKKSPEMTQWFYENFPEIESTEASLSDEGAIRSVIASEEGTMGFYHDCLLYNLLGPFEDDKAFEALFESSLNNESKRQLAAHSTASGLARWVCRFDQPFLLEKLQRLGFPALLQVRVGHEELGTERNYEFNTLGMAQQESAEKVIAYLAEQGYTVDWYAQAAKKLIDWCLSIEPELDRIETVAKLCSRQWIKATTEKLPSRWQQDDWLIAEMAHLVREAKSTHALDSVYGDDKLLFVRSGGLIARGGGYQIVTTDEVLADLALRTEPT